MRIRAGRPAPSRLASCGLGLRALPAASAMHPCRRRYWRQHLHPPRQRAPKPDRRPRDLLDGSSYCWDSPGPAAAPVGRMPWCRVPVQHFETCCSGCQKIVAGLKQPGGRVSPIRRPRTALVLQAAAAAAGWWWCSAAGCHPVRACPAWWCYFHSSGSGGGSGAQRGWPSTCRCWLCSLRSGWR